MRRSIRNSRNKLKILNVFIVAIGILAIVATVSPAIAKQANEASYEAKVIGITDGDTIKVLTSTKEQVKIRIYGIDAPEKKQAFGSKAKDFLSSLIFGCAVTVQPNGKDIYGRTIAKIYHADRDVGLAMIECGYAWWYQQYAKKDVDYKQAQQKAKAQQLGLWADPNPVDPAKFRKYKTKSEEKK